MSIKLPKIFLDSGDPAETKKARSLLGYLDGQTTNPSLVAKNPEIQTYLSQGKKLTEKELLNMYKQIIQQIAKETEGAISIEVYGDWKTSKEQMLAQADEMYTWAKNAYIKFPTIPAGLDAASEFTKKGGRVNMTLVFDLQQAAAVYVATKETKQNIFISPFIGRWDDRGYLGLDLVQNILKLNKQFDKKLHAKKSHVSVLAASIRSMEHFYSCIFLGADILTIPYKIIQQWVEEERWMPDERYRIDTKGLKAIRYEDLGVLPDYSQYKIDNSSGSLLDEGIGKFAKDWNNLVSH